MSEKDVSSRRDVLKTAGALAAGAAMSGLFTAAKAAAAKEEGKAPRLGMVIDLRKCVGCFSCQVSCKMENGVPMAGFNSWVKVYDMGEYPKAKRVFLPRLCNHCEGTEKDKVPPCVKICPEYPKKRQTFTTADGKKITYRDGATYKRPDGLILIDNDPCTGCGKCIKECAFGSRYFDPRIKSGADKTKNAVGKCNFCQHRIEKGLEPACVRNCVGKARTFGDLNDPNSEVSQLIKNNPAKTLKPPKLKEDIRPRVYYIGLDEDVAKIEAKTEEEINTKPQIIYSL